MIRKSEDRLVTVYLENIHGDVLTNYPQLVRAYIKGKHGIYALYNKSKLYYVGLATNLSRRLKYHLRDRHKGMWDRFSIYITKDHQHMKDLESLFLRIAKPSGNKVKGKFVKANLLNRRFKNDLKRQMMRHVSILVDGEIDRDAGGVRSEETNKKAPALAPYIEGGFEIRMEYKGRIIKARVGTDGKISYKGKTYTSPSIAGAYARRKKTLNGWKSWKYKNKEGDWVYLDEIRKKKAKSKKRAGRKSDKLLAKKLAGKRLRLTYKGKTYSAYVLRSGRIKLRHNGKIFDSPTGAAVAVMKRRQGITGWGWWKFRNRKGEWVPISEAR